MITRVVMPKLTDTMEEGVVVSWKKTEGDEVAAGDILAEIETDKAVMDLESFGSGFFRKALANEGDTVQAGTLIALIGELNDDIEPYVTEEATEDPDSTDSDEKTERSTASQSKASKAEPATANTSEPKDAQAERPPEELPSPSSTSPKKISPRAKKKAHDMGINLSNIEGSGPGGRIVERDVVRFPQRVPKQRKEVIDRPLSQARKAIARITTESKAPVPHFYLTLDISMTEVERLREQMNLIQETSLNLTTLLIHAVMLALTKHPDINVSYTGDAIRYHPTIDIGVAVALDEGLITPVIRDCAHKTLRELSQECFRMIRLAKNQRLKPEEYSGATFSISNLGMYGIQEFSAVLIPPQAASLAVGAIQSVPVVENDTVIIDQRMTVTLSCDHRVLDGAQAALFLQTLKKTLEAPLELFLS
ncbi:MAG: acetyltransferase component of pyruvate dehydrogenase complex [Nitrospirales bacterium]|nr:MAG: acetyltransferase component of pyruvate dehydrogenase complex [Nitrospirales bacterium]